MSDAEPIPSQSIQADWDALFAALCREVGFCLHEKGEARVKAALPKGLDAGVRAVLAAEGVDEPNAPGDLKRAVRDCLKAHLPQLGRDAGLN